MDIPHYKDSDERIIRAYYQLGISKRNSKDWDGAVTAFSQAGEYSDARVQITETYYQQAKYLYSCGEYKKAYDIFGSISNYRDAENILNNDPNMKKITWTTVGNIVSFGAYEQDNNKNNGSEPIEWIILDVKENTSILLSLYGLDYAIYDNQNITLKNYQNITVTWEKCSLRKWLNNDFFNNAFSANERKMIVKDTVLNDKSQHDKIYNSDITAGNNTKDYVYLLSHKEAYSYLKTNEERICTITKYAKAQIKKMNGACTTDTGWWWLRSPGGSLTSSTELVTGSGKDITLFANQSDYDTVVRPVIRVNTDMD